ncbi:hypothetical protein H1C71_038699, partial [Ictidomys tridecemlineatus]|uniref:Vomeronasal type-1 receptor n=1 Tax=Ictidomys tridecemlineatus TaxID=43179 RepID=A0A287CW74_ICTTR
MAASDVAVGIIFMAETVVGALGNSSLLLHYLVLYFTGCRVRHTDLILQHLIVTNLLTLLYRRVPHTKAAFGMKGFLGDLGCKLLFYLHRVRKGVSIGSTCILSVFQAIKIMKSPNWIVYIFLNVMFSLVMTGKGSNRNITSLKDFGYCSVVRHDKTTDSLLAALLTFPDALCVGLMLWASSSMVLILHRHKQRIQHLHKSSSPRSSAESRATKTILLLVSIFVSFYTISCICHICLALVSNPTWFLLNTTAVITGCFPAVSPFLLMSS